MADIELPDPDELEEMRGKQFTRRVALTTAIFAVMLAITSLGGNNAMKGMLMAQQQASDQWAFYQSKVMREHSYKIQRLQTEALLMERGKAMSPGSRENYESLAASFREEEGRYNKEKKAIESAARKLEQERDMNNSKDPYFDFAEVLLQIAIVMASISILSGTRRIFYFAVLAAVLGSILSLNGFILAFRIPFLH